jgi:thioredoxin 1
VIEKYYTHALPLLASSMEANIAFRLSGNTPNIYFVKVNVDEAEDISQEYGIRAMPTFILFKDGEKVNEVVGADPGKVEQLVQSA